MRFFGLLPVDEEGGRLAGFPSWVDPVLTWVILLGGADRIAAWVKVPGGTARIAPPPPVVVTGTLKLDDGRGRD